MYSILITQENLQMCLFNSFFCHFFILELIIFIVILWIFSIAISFFYIWSFLLVHKNIIIIGDPSETDMPDWRPIGDLNMLHQRLACLIGDLDMLHWRHQHAYSETHWKPTYLIGEPQETHMPDRRPIGDLNMLHWRPTGMLFSDGSPIGHVGFRWISDGVCQFQLIHRWNMLRSLIGLRSSMSVSNGKRQLPMGHVSLWWVSNQACQSPM